MFKKTWKQIKILIILIIILICMPHSLLPHHSDSVDTLDLAAYKQLNDNENRLMEFKDDDEALKLKFEQLSVINQSRRKYNAPVVKLDILASRVANKISKEAAENDYLGHWNLNGQEPYLRYAFAGGYDHVTENAYGEWSSAKYNSSPQTIGQLMKTGHDKFMSERPPADGHRENIIKKEHNYVGIGFGLSGIRFRYYEEFIDRYLEFENIPASANTNETVSITVKTNGQSFLYYLIAYREKYPEPLSPKEISRRESYNDYTNEISKEILAWDLSHYRNGNTYRVPLSFSKEGLYYIQIYTDKKEITKPKALNTKGKTPESGIVISIQK